MVAAKLKMRRESFAQYEGAEAEARILIIMTGITNDIQVNIEFTNLYLPR
jgi:hypothetical protein